MQPEQRRRLFTTTLGGFLAAGGQLLLVAEPSIAALWFYGILRLLPNIPLFAGMGFSTYEPQVASLGVPLVATCFAQPATTDLAKRLYSSPRFAMNTYRKRCSRALGGDRPYAQFIVDRLVRYEWPAVERFLVRLQVGGAKTVEDLETMTLRLAGAAGSRAQTAEFSLSRGGGPKAHVARNMSAGRDNRYGFSWAYSRRPQRGAIRSKSASVVRSSPPTLIVIAAISTSAIEHAMPSRRHASLIRAAWTWCASTAKTTGNAATAARS